MTSRLKILLRGDADEISRWLAEPGMSWGATCVLVILIGSGLYGFTVGLWRAPLQSLYTAIKFPLLIFLTCAGNALLNGLLAQLLGSGLSFRQTSVAILMSFVLTGLILGAHIMGHQASSLIQPLVQAMNFDLPAQDMARGQYWIHPALPEVVENALLGLQ